MDGTATAHDAEADAEPAQRIDIAGLLAAVLGAEVSSGGSDDPLVPGNNSIEDDPRAGVQLRGGRPARSCRSLFAHINLPLQTCLERLLGKWDVIRDV